MIPLCFIGYGAWRYEETLKFSTGIQTDANVSKASEHHHHDDGVTALWNQTIDVARLCALSCVCRFQTLAWLLVFSIRQRSPRYRSPWNSGVTLVPGCDWWMEVYAPVAVCLHCSRERRYREDVLSMFQPQCCGWFPTVVSRMLAAVKKEKRQILYPLDLLLDTKNTRCYKNSKIKNNVPDIQIVLHLLCFLPFWHFKVRATLELAGLFCSK